MNAGITKIPVTMYGVDGGDPFPCLSDLWKLYSVKGTKTIFVSVGLSKSPMADLDIAELLGCPIHIVPLNEEHVNMWDEVKRILVVRERNDSSSIYDFSKDVSEKWVLPKNVQIHKSLPWWNNATIQMSENDTLKTREFYEWVEDACKLTKLESDVRLDILKLDMGNGMERSVLVSMLNAGFRPACILVNWEYAPDTHTPTTLAAGHLQTCGYKLISKVDNKFFYFFIDQDMYMTCSWEDTRAPNPMVHEILSNYEILKSRQEMSKNGTNKSFSQNNEIVDSNEPVITSDGVITPKNAE
jgi:hypothetical protein